MRGGDLIFFDESDESGAFNFDGLSRTVVDGDHEVEEVRLAQIRRRLFLKVRSTHSQTKPKPKPKPKKKTHYFQVYYISIIIQSKSFNIHYFSFHSNYKTIAIR